ncbi:MAG: hypothetical protein HC881_14990 [Leptolyngbyaceae cyanobacterium SL_7_1]|nr:hypothetical protein [Leptolyngbyaceae cyanobacterium SL_7_1]
MFRGLLAGASSRSQEIREVSGQLLVELNALIDRIQSEIRAMLLEQAAMGLLAIITGGVTLPANAAAWVRRLNRLRRLIQNAQRAFAVYEQIERIISTIRTAHATYTDFKQRVDEKIERLRSLQAQLEALESAESLEAEIEQLQEEITADFEQQMGEGGNLAQLLESLYIPAETTNEELLEILLDIPRGLDDLERMIAFYNQIEGSDNAQDTIALGAIAVRAGARLYPLVGFMAAKIAEALPQILPERTPQERLMQFVDRVGTRLSGGTRRDQNRGIFARLRGNRYEYDAADLRRHLEWGRTRLLAILQQEEPTGHWVISWFRYSLRQKVRVLIQEARTRRTRGRRRQRRGVPVAPWQDVPLPPFRIRIPLWQPSGQLHATLSLNPDTTIRVDRLTMRDFGGAGLLYASASDRRRRAIREWLTDRNYEFTDQNRHIRLAGATPASFTKPYLQLENDHIKRDNALTVTRSHVASRFINRTVESESDADLPEGYFFQTRRGSVYVVKKRGIGRRLPQLGFDSNGRLQMQAVGGRQITRIRRIGGSLLPPQMEAFDYTQCVESMFVNRQQARAGINVEGRNKIWWTQHIERTPQLHRRPTVLSGTFGYVQGARLLGDRLRNKFLPELKNTDDKGHLVARQFDGNDEYYNLIPMDSTLNQHGAWRDVERAIATAYEPLPANRRIDVSITIRYPNRYTRRPSAFVISWSEIGGSRLPINHPSRRMSNR